MAYPNLTSTTRTRFSRAVILTVIAPSLFACQTARLSSVSADDLLVAEDALLTPPASLTADDVSKDTAVLLYAFREGYGGRKYVPAAEFELALKKVADSKISGATVLDTLNFCKTIGSALLEIPDNHLTARLNGQDCNSEHDRLFVSGSVGKNVTSKKNRPWDLNFRVAEKRRVPIISITDFPKHEDPAWAGFLDVILDAKKNAPAIIIDLRGNGGGDDTMGRTMASYLYGRDYPSAYDSIIKSQTPATFALAANNIQLRILRLKKKREAVPSYLEERLRTHLANYREAKAARLPVEKVGPGEQGYPFDPKKAFTKPIYLLIDRGCQSSCESTLEAFEAHPYAVTIGENTGGFIHFGNMGQLLLPRSKIVVQMATDFWKFRDGRFVEKIGYAPKLRVNPGTDALAVALRKLKDTLTN